MGLNIYRECQSRMQLVGTLDSTGSFSYDAAYLADVSARAISFSLPLQASPYRQDQAIPYFKGLLPEGRSLDSLAARLGRSTEDYLGLLGECGLDCVGDIIISPERYTATRSYRKVGLDEIRHALSSERADVANVLLSSSRLSLAGTQTKIGLYVAEAANSLADDAAWYLPEGGAPSNCILKIASENLLPDLMVTEQLCMASARGCGIRTAKTELVPIGQGAIIVRRFDRSSPSEECIDGLSVPLRQHQEDFTQVLGLTPGSKYAELEVGTAKTIADFLRTHSASPVQDLRHFLGIALFNYVIGNADNHLKNLSILYNANWNAIQLAPAYDLVSTTYYARFSRTMGMAIGSTREIDAVCAQDIEMLASQINVSKSLLEKTARSIVRQIVPALHAEAKRLNDAGYANAPYIADDLEEDFTPRLHILESVCSKQ